MSQPKPVTPMASDVPTLTTPAEVTSPMRAKNVSIAALALYLASRDVGRNSAYRTVFWIE